MATEGLGESQNTQWLAQVYENHSGLKYAGGEDKNPADDDHENALDGRPDVSDWSQPGLPWTVENEVQPITREESPEASHEIRLLSEEPSEDSEEEPIVFEYIPSNPLDPPVEIHEIITDAPPPAATSDSVLVVDKDSKPENHDRQGETYSLSKNLSHPTMEDYSPQQASDGSILSTTQENTPGIYQRYLQEHGISQQDSPKHDQPTSWGKPAEFDAADLDDDLSQVSHSYEEDDTGAVKFSFPTIPVHDNPYDMGSEQEGLDSDNMPFDPKTPAQARPPIQNVGSVMGATQLFAATQPSSPNARDLIEPSSARPSPDVYNDFTSPKRNSASPLLRRLHPSQRTRLLPHQTLSSPSQLRVHGSSGNNDVPQDSIETGEPVSTIPLLPANFISRDDAEPLDTYISRKQSQERRQLKMRLSEDHDSQMSDDDYLDIGGDKGFHSKWKKDNAVKQLANVNISMTPKNAKEDVEVPGTNRLPGTDRHRSMSEEYIAQCHGTDARDSQQDERIADSQSRPGDGIARAQFGWSSMSSNEKREVIAVERSSGNAHLGPGSASHPSKHDEDVSDHLPALDLNTDSLDTSSVTGAPDSLFGDEPTQALSEISPNKNSIHPHSPYKSAPLSDEGRILETSPFNDGSRPFGDIDDESVPAPMYSDPDLTAFDMTQDEDYDVLIASKSSPVRPANRRTFRRNIVRDSSPHERADLSGSSKLEDAEIDDHPAMEPEQDLHASKSVPKESTMAENSEYVTAPEEQVNTSRLSENSLSNPTGGSLVHDDEKSELPARDDHPSENPEASIEVTPRRALATLNPNQNDMASATIVPDSAIKRTGLRSADKLKGPSKALRGKVFTKDTKSSVVTPSRTEPVSELKKSTRSSIRQSSRISNKLNTPEPEIPTPMRAKVEPRSGSDRNGLALFGNMAFSVSYGSNEREKLKVTRLIKENGGRLLEEGFDELFESNASRKNSPKKNPGDKDDNISKSQLCLTAEAQEIGFTCLIADDHSRRTKYMQALALGLPCISGRWIEHCVAKNEIISWDVYLLAAGVSTFLGNAVRSRNLQAYEATEANFANGYASRKKLLDNQSILLVVGKGRVEERKRAYLFLTQALGAQCVKRVTTNIEARKFLFEAEREGKPFDWVYVAEKEDEAEKVIFGNEPARKRKRGSNGTDDPVTQPAKKVRIVNDEFVIQSLILGKLLDWD